MKGVKNFFWFFRLVVCIILPGYLIAGQTELENWTFLGGKTHLGNMEFSFHSANFFRHGSDFFLNHTQLSLDFPSKGNISCGIGYKQEYVEFPGKWRREYRPMLDLYYKRKWGNLAFRDRNRWEFRILDGELINRYRNQVQLTYTKFEKIEPYISTEFSFYINHLDYTRQRTLVGAQIPIKKVDLNLFIGQQVNEDFPGVWGNRIMLGSGLNYNF